MDSQNRRTAIKTMGAVSAAIALPFPAMAREFSEQIKKPLKLGLIADLHGGLAVDAEDRLDAFLSAMEQENCDALIQLGDFAYPNEAHQRFADKFNSAHPNTLHVIGNHEFDFELKREDCYQAWGIPTSYYQQDIGDIRLLILDGNEKGSPNHGGGYPSYIGAAQQAWLSRQLSESPKPVLIFCHQPLAGVSAIDNAPEIQNLLADHANKILLCLNGHSHVDAYTQVKNVGFLHINSASYYWVGGKTRMAYYGAPLYTTLTIEPETATVRVSESLSTWQSASPADIDYFNRPDPPPQNIVTPRIRPRQISHSNLTVMTWNIWGRLNKDPKYSINDKTARQRTIEIIRNSGADVIAMIETYGSAAEIAADLGFEHYTPAADANLCIFSRYPLTDIELLDGLNPFSFIAATITMPGGQAIRIYDIWLTSGGRHIVEIKNRDLSDEDFTRGDDLRFDHLSQLLKHPTFQRDLAGSEKTPLIVAGDFNCISHLDHSSETKRRSLNHSRISSNKVSQAMQQLGFTDSFRSCHQPLSEQNLGHTWTTVGKDYRYQEGQGFVPVKDHPQPEYREPFARIDYIYCRGDALEILDSSVLRHHPAEPQRMFPEFPSDHAAVLTKFRIVNS